MSEDPEIVEIRNARVALVLILAIKLGLGALLLVVWLVGVINGAPTEKLLLPLGAGLLLVFVGLFSLGTALDREVKVTLCAEGFRDHRTRDKELVPWSNVRSVANVPGHGNGSASLHFALVHPARLSRDILTGSGRANTAGDKYRIEISTLDINARDFIGHVRRFAPHVTVETLFAPKP